MAPGYAYPGVPAYLCGHNLLKSHGVAVDLYRKKGYKGKIGITMDSYWYEPKTNSTSDALAAEQAYQFYVSLAINSSSPSNCSVMHFRPSSPHFFHSSSPPPLDGLVCAPHLLRRRQLSARHDQSNRQIEQGTGPGQVQAAQVHCRGDSVTQMLLRLLRLQYVHVAKGDPQRLEEQCQLLGALGGARRRSGVRLGSQLEDSQLLLVCSESMICLGPN